MREKIEKIEIVGSICAPHAPEKVFGGVEMLKIRSKNGWIYVGKAGAPAEVWEEILPEIMAAISAEDLPQYERVYDPTCGWYTRASFGSKKRNEYMYWRAQAQNNLRAALRLKHEETTGRT